MNIQLSEDSERQIHSLVQEGVYGSADEVIADALRLLARQQPARRPMTEAEFKQHLLNTGLMTSLPIPSDSAPSPPFQPVTIEGEPLSETVIRERR